MASLSGKLAVVTGAGSGIGKAVCSLFTNKGARVIGVDAKRSSLDTLSIEDKYKFTVDVSNRDQVQKLYTDINKNFGQVADVLVNSAGITRDNFLLKLSEEHWDEVLNVNLKGTFLMTQAHCQHLVKAAKSMSSDVKDKSGLTGSIVNIASVTAKGNVGQPNYSASKAGVVGFTKTCALEMSRYGIRVNCILPGYIHTPMTNAVPDNIMQKAISMIPLHRAGEPEEVANLIAFLASDDSAYMTGTAVDIDGGLKM